MQLTVREAAGYLNVDESTLRRWISTRGLPVHRVHERIHLNAIEVWEWALEHGVPASRRLLEEAQRAPQDMPPLSTLLALGGIHHGIGGTDQRQVFAQILERLPLGPDVDREFLLTVLEAREALGSTAVGDGIAIPHVRNPILLHITEPFVSLCLLAHPIPFGALDGRPVHALFLVVSPNVPGHLHILAQLGFVLRDRRLRDLLGEGAPAAEILERIQFLELQTTGALPVVPRLPR